MRKLTGAVFQSLDGIMQAPGGPDEDPSSGFRYGGWSFHFWDESLEKPFGPVIDADYDLLLGKRTYDIFSSFWPKHQEDPIGARFQRINKYVLTHSNEPLQWERSEKLSGDTAEVVGKLKQSEGRDLLIQGSSTIYAPLLSAGLIDRLITMVFPVILGTGKSIFDGSPDAGALKLVKHTISDKGVAFLEYEPAGEVPIGSFADEAEHDQAEVEG
jgi:dihydrofolate reductase